MHAPLISDNIRDETQDLIHSCGIDPAYTITPLIEEDYSLALDYASCAYKSLKTRLKPQALCGFFR